MSIPEKVELVYQYNIFNFPPYLNVLMELVDRALDRELHPASKYCHNLTHYPGIANFSNQLCEMGGDHLLSALGNYVPVDSVRSCRKRAPLHMVQSGVFAWCNFSFVTSTCISWTCIRYQNKRFTDCSTGKGSLRASRGNS